MVGLTAVKAVAIDFALELPFVLLDVALAPAKVVRCSAACGAEQEKPTKRCGEQRRFPTLCKSKDVAPDHNGLPATAASAWSAWPGLESPSPTLRRTQRPIKKLRGLGSGALSETIPRGPCPASCGISRAGNARARRPGPRYRRIGAGRIPHRQSRPSGAWRAN